MSHNLILNELIKLLKPSLEKFEYFQCDSSIFSFINNETSFLKIIQFQYHPYANPGFVSISLRIGIEWYEPLKLLYERVKKNNSKKKYITLFHRNRSQIVPNIKKQSLYLIETLDDIPLTVDLINYELENFVFPLLNHLYDVDSFLKLLKNESYNPNDIANYRYFDDLFCVFIKKMIDGEKDEAVSFLKYIIDFINENTKHNQSIIYNVQHHLNKIKEIFNLNIVYNWELKTVSLLL